VERYRLCKHVDDSPICGDAAPHRRILSVQNSLYAIHPSYGPTSRKRKFLLPTREGKRSAVRADRTGKPFERRRVTNESRQEGDNYVLNGNKSWITNGGASDAAIVYVNTDPAKGEKGSPHWSWKRARRI